MRPFATIVGLGLTVGCTSAPIYYPMNRHAPLLSARNETHIGAHFNGERGVALEVSKALTDSSVVLLTIATANHDPCSTCDVDKHSYGELAIGKLRRTTSGIVRARLVGIGAGTTAGSGCGSGIGDCLDYSRAEGTFGRAFVQFDRPRRTGRLSTAVSVRASAVYFSEFSRQPSDSNGGPPFGVFLEPTYLIGLQPFKGPLRITVQVGGAVPLSPLTSFGQVPVLGGFGLTMNW